MRNVILVCTLAISAVAARAGDDWPQWRGQERDGISKETNLLKSWPEGGPKLLWSKEGIGTGFASISISNDVIYIT